MKRKLEKANSREKKRENPPPDRLPSGKTDPQGSYTGRPVNPREEPVQDADDL